MSVAASLNVLLTATTTQFSSQMKKAEAQTTHFQAVTNRAAVGLGKLNAAFAVVGGTAAAYKIGNAFVSTVTAIDDAADAAERLGVSFQTMQGFEVVARRAGIGTEVMTNALDKMNIKLGEAREGSASAQAAFARLGAGGLVAGGADTESVFFKVIESLNGIEDASQRAAAQQAIFGKGSKELAEVLGLTAEQFGAMVEQMKATGQIMSGEQLNAVKENVKAINEMSVAWKQATQNAAAYVAPTITQGLHVINAAMAKQLTLAQAVGISGGMSPDRASQLSRELEATRNQKPGTTVDNSFKRPQGGANFQFAPQFTPRQALPQFSGAKLLASMSEPFAKVAAGITRSVEDNSKAFNESVARIDARKAAESKAMESMRSISALSILGGGVADFIARAQEQRSTIVGPASAISAGSQADALFEMRRQQQDQGKDTAEKKGIPLLQKAVQLLEDIKRAKPDVFEMNIF